MAKYATKAKENIFTQARYNAAKFNDRLNLSLIHILTRQKFGNSVK